MPGRAEQEAARLAEIEQRLVQLQRALRSSSSVDSEALIIEVDALLEEAKRLSRDGHTMALARIAISAGWVRGRLERRRSGSR